MTSAKQANVSQHGIFYGCIDLLFLLAHLHMAHLLKFQRQTLLPRGKLGKIKLETENFQILYYWAVIDGIMSIFRLKLTFDSSRLFFAIMYNWAIRYSSTVMGRGIRYSFISILNIDYNGTGTSIEYDYRQCLSYHFLQTCWIKSSSIHFLNSPMIWL